MAARNILLAEGNVVKIADFGLSRQIKYNDGKYQKQGEVICYYRPSVCWPAYINFDLNASIIGSSTSQVDGHRILDRPALFNPVGCLVLRRPSLGTLFTWLNALCRSIALDIVSISTYITFAAFFYIVDVTTVKELIHFLLKEGQRLTKPHWAPNNVVDDLMKACWQTNPKDRPSFAHLKHTLAHLMEPSAYDHYEKLIKPYVE